MPGPCRAWLSHCRRLYQQRRQPRAASQQAETINRGVEQASALTGGTCTGHQHGSELMPYPTKLQALASSCCSCSTRSSSLCLADMILTLRLMCRHDSDTHQLTQLLTTCVHAAGLCRVVAPESFLHRVRCLLHLQLCLHARVVSCLQAPDKTGAHREAQVDVCLCPCRSPDLRIHCGLWLYCAFPSLSGSCTACRMPCT